MGKDEKKSIISHISGQTLSSNVKRKINNKTI